MTDLAGVTWRTSSYTNGNGGACVEVADLPDGRRAVRDTKDFGTGPILLFGPEEWRAFVAGVKSGDFA
ncbi:DUF397 domain-containing protein [Pseudonocardia sp. CNS-139]|nr:DUF397 domain-containing protein [Pseudonocardia sp. CNS-139]